MEPSAENLSARRVLMRFSEADQYVSVESKRSAGGFSGAEFWRVCSPQGNFCLRRWPPEHPSPHRLAFIHRLLGHAVQRGVTEIAVPLRDRTGETIAREDGSLWELTRWMPGIADYRDSPSPRKLSAAMQLLARFHLAAAEVARASVDSSLGLVARAAQLRRLLAGEIKLLERQFQAVNSSVLAESSDQAEQGSSISMSFNSTSVHRDIAQCARQFLDCFPRLAPQIMDSLDQSSHLGVPLQPCIRDVWHDHILYLGEQVTGLVDFGSLRDDHIAADISRLLGSLVGDDPSGWTEGIAAYERVRPLSAVDRHLISVYDQSGILLSAMNWMQWLYVSGRRFEDLRRVHQRCTEIAMRLRHLAKL